jgi:hypothetical protein
VVPLQHSPDIMQRSPIARQLPAAQRRTPSAPAAQTPEQQLAATAQRSPAGPQPANGWQRGTPSAPARHRPEQQCMSSGQCSPTTEQPPIFWQIDAPDGCTLHWPSQQSDGRSQVSPSTRQPLSAAQREPPIAGRQRVEQQSPFVLHVSPAGRQPGDAGNMHFPAAHTSPQHCVAVLQTVVAGKHSPGWHVAVAASHSSEQHAPARSQG